MADAKQTAELAAYKMQVLRWLRRKEAKWRDAATHAPGAASDAASFYAAAYANAAQGIGDGEPEKRAAIEGVTNAE